MRRRETPDLYRAIVRRHLPRGWTVRERPEGRVHRGSCDFNRRMVFVPPLVDRPAAYIALHECAHARLHTGPDIADDAGALAYHVQEYEAEQLAIALMRLEGLAMPREELRGARRNVTRNIHRDEARGWSIDPVIKRWARA